MTRILTRRSAVSALAAAALLAAPPATALAQTVSVAPNAPYLFFGSRLQNVVHVVPRDGQLAAEYYTWGGSGHLPFWPASYPLWRNALDELGVRWVVLVSRPEADPERRWMRERGRFARVYADDVHEIWRLDRRPAPGRRRPVKERPPRRRAAPDAGGAAAAALPRRPRPAGGLAAAPPSRRPPAAPRQAATAPAAAAPARR